VARIGLLNLSDDMSGYGDKILASADIYHTVFAEKHDKNEVAGILDAMVDFNYLRKDSEYYYTITGQGWKKIEELKKEKSYTNQGFIAMAFGKETNLISDTFKKAIAACGYNPCRIDEKQHNNQIVPEILYEISRSKFVVVDITYPNYGAYYEAGYAQALGKEVIVCCRESEFNKEGNPHFDIAQKCMIVWSDEQDLEERLCKRIEATVGLNK